MRNISNRDHVRTIMGKLNVNCEAQLYELPADELSARCVELTKLEQQVILQKIRREDIADIFKSPWASRHNAILEEGGT